MSLRSRRALPWCARFYGSWRNAIDTNFVRSKFHRRDLSEHFNSTLACRVVDEVRERPFVATRADVDDRTAGAVHNPGGTLCAQKAAPKVGRQDTVPIGIRQLEQRLPGLNSRIVHQDVQPSENLERALEKGINLIGLGDIAAHA